jgi:hypothetical protein
MNAFLYVAQTLAVVGLSVVGLYAAARFIGLGVCRACAAKILPWNAYCETHLNDSTPKEDDGAPAQ